MSKPRATQRRRIRRKHKRIYGHPKWDDWAGRKPDRPIRRRYRWALEDDAPDYYSSQKHYGHNNGEQYDGDYARDYTDNRH